MPTVVAVVSEKVTRAATDRGVRGSHLQDIPSKSAILILLRLVDMLLLVTTFVSLSVDPLLVVIGFSVSPERFVRRQPSRSHDKIRDSSGKGETRGLAGRDGAGEKKGEKHRNVARVEKGGSM
jgi:hypothetical protein